MTIEINGEEYELRIRKLTEDECYILQGLTKEDAIKCKNVGISKTHIYRTAGNGIAVPCVQLLFEHLYKAQYNNDFECTDERILQEQEDEDLFS